MTQKRITVDNMLSLLMVVGDDDAPPEVQKACRLLSDYMTNDAASGWDRQDTLLVFE